MMIIWYILTSLCSLQDQRDKLDIMELEDTISIIGCNSLYKVQSSVYSHTVGTTTRIINELVEIIKNDNSKKNKFSTDDSKKNKFSTDDSKKNKFSTDDSKKNKFSTDDSKKNKFSTDNLNNLNNSNTQDNLDNIKFNTDYKTYILQYNVAYNKNKKLLKDIQDLQEERTNYIMKNLNVLELNSVTSSINIIMKDFVNINTRMYNIIKKIETKNKRGKKLREDILKNSEDILKKSIGMFNELIKYISEKEFISRFVFGTEEFIKKDEIIETKREFQEVLSSLEND